MKIKIRLLLCAALAMLAAVLACRPSIAQDYKVGNRVAMPAGYSDKWLDAVVVAIDPGKPFPYRVHPLGYSPYADESFKASMLKAPGTVKTEPIGGIKDDPYLLAITGQKKFQPTKLIAGGYECWTLSGGRLQASMAVNFTIVDETTYHDAGGNRGSYRFDPASATLVFQGGGLDGVRGTYAQASNPPTASQPPSVTLTPSGDVCEHPVR